jgi:NarL family two-component system response regulator LiaR
MSNPTAPSAVPLEPSTSNVLVAVTDRASVVAVGLSVLLADQPGISLVPPSAAASAPGSGVFLFDASAPPATYADAAALTRDAGWPCLALAWPEEQRRLMRVPAAGPEPDGWLPKGADGPTLAAAIRHARRRQLHAVSGPGTTSRGGRSLALSARERQMLVLISAGLSNEEIAVRCYLSINSVKTFIRAAYRKIGVERRVEAAMWVAEHLDPGTDSIEPTPVAAPAQAV